MDSHSSILQYTIHAHTEKQISFTFLPDRVVAFCEWLWRSRHWLAEGPVPLVGSSLLDVTTLQLHPKDEANHYPAVDANPKTAARKRPYKLLQKKCFLCHKNNTTPCVDFFVDLF